jgi:peptidoglycan hydrolase-like protein with peptidoglycan-binding domain
MKSFFLITAVAFVMGHSAMAQSRYGGQVLEKSSSPVAANRHYIQLLQLDLYFLHYGVYLDAYGGATGEYNEATMHAVIGFQKDHGLLENGVVGKETAIELEKALAQTDLGEAWIRFNPMRYGGVKLKKGDRDKRFQNAVALLQKDLKEVGFETIDPSGVFDESTELALTAFQQETLVPSTKILDEVTVTALTERLCVPIKKVQKKKK